eukprot:gene6888-7583_t
MANPWKSRKGAKGEGDMENLEVKYGKLQQETTISKKETTKDEDECDNDGEISDNTVDDVVIADASDGTDHHEESHGSEGDQPLGKETKQRKKNTKTGCQYSIHLLNLNREVFREVKHNEGHAAKKIINILIEIYNRNHPEGDPFRLLETKEGNRTFFDIHVCYRQSQTQIQSDIIDLIKNPEEIKKDLIKQHFVLFYSRKDEENKLEMFAVTQDQGYHLVKKMSNFDFPKKFLLRCSKEAIYNPELRHIAGCKHSSTTHYRAPTPGPNCFFRNISAVFLKSLITIKPDCSLYDVSPFKEKYFPGKKEINATVGNGKIQFNCNLTANDFFVILAKLSEIFRGHTNDRISSGLENLYLIDQVDCYKAKELNEELLRQIHKQYIEGENDLDVSFVHYHYRDFYNAPHVDFKFRNVVIQETPTTIINNPMKVLSDLLNCVCEDSMKKYKKFDGFRKSFESIKCRFYPKSYESVYNFLEGTIQKHGDGMYCRLGKIWYFMRMDILSFSRIEFVKLLKRRLLLNSSCGRLPKLWPKINDKYVCEEVYNRKYMGHCNYLVFDQVFLNEGHGNIELFDIMYKGEKNIYLYHVKTGFDQRIRVACSQIQNAAFHLESILRNNKDELENMYDRVADPNGAAQSDFRSQLREDLQNFWPKEKFLECFEDPKKIVFVLAFFDDAKSERELENVVTKSECSQTETQPGDKFQSMIAQFEILHLENDLQRNILNFGFKICQISRS